jgi:hypothetical protein
MILKALPLSFFEGLSLHATGDRSPRSGILNAFGARARSTNFVTLQLDLEKNTMVHDPYPESYATASADAGMTLISSTVWA